MTTDVDDYRAVIVIGYQTEYQRFWSGTRWVSEYPDARVYSSFASGCRAFSLCNVRQSLRNGEGSLVENYGLESENVALTTKDDR